MNWFFLTIIIAIICITLDHMWYVYWEARRRK
jgi:hypothetical protein